MKQTDDKQSSFYEPGESNKLVMDLRLYDEEYEDQHHVITSVALNLRVGGKVLVTAEASFGRHY